MNKDDFCRRSVIGMAGSAAISLACTSTAESSENAFQREPIKIAGYPYDRVRAIQHGGLELDDRDYRFYMENIYALNRHAFGATQKYEVSEMGLIPYITRFANHGFRDYTLLPIFISRIFRHRNIFVRTDSGIKKPEDLKGKRVATPGYGMSACTWIRGFLQDIHGVKPSDLNWIETTKSSDGGKVNSGLGKYFLPDGFPLKKGPEGIDESEMLISGDADAVISAITPKGFLDGDSKIRRLFPDFQKAEQEYFKETRVFPIMHVVAIRKDVAANNPGLPKALFSLYSQAKKVAYDDLETTTALKVTLPWVTTEFEETRKLMGNNYWPYGFKANRKELDLVMRYVHEQGLTRKRIRSEELFHPSTLDLIEK